MNGSLVYICEYIRIVSWRGVTLSTATDPNVHLCLSLFLLLIVTIVFCNSSASIIKHYILWFLLFSLVCIFVDWHALRRSLILEFIVLLLAKYFACYLRISLSTKFRGLMELMKTTKFCFQPIKIDSQYIKM